MPEKGGFLAFGNAVVDVYADVPEGFPARLGFPSGSVNHGPRGSWIDAVREYGCAPISGGASANAMKVAGYSGARCAFSGAVGDDDEAGLFRASLENAGVSHSLAVKSRPTGVFVSMREPSGLVTILADKGAAAMLSPEDILAAPFSEYGTAVIEGYLLADKAVFASILSRAKTSKARICLDLSSETLVACHREYLAAEVLPDLSFLFMNENEYKALFALDFSREDTPCSRLGCLCVVKLGARGAFAFQGKERWFCPAPDVAVVDATGAGDAFLGGFLAAEDGGCTIETCLERAKNAAGAVLGVRGTNLGGISLLRR